MPIRERVQFASLEGARVGLLGLGINTTFVVYRMGRTLIDTGPPNQWAAVRGFLDEQPPERLLLTHHHEDHTGNAGRIARRYGLKPLAPALSLHKLRRGYRIPPIQKLVWGSPNPVEADPLPARVVLPEGTLSALHTPGHSKDMTCLLWEEEGALFSADLYVSRSLKYLRADEDLGLLMQSIRRVLDLDFEVLLCPHRGIVLDGRVRMQQKLENLSVLCEEASELASQGLVEAEIVRRLLGPEDWISMVSFYDISKRNLVRQALLTPPEALRCR